MPLSIGWRLLARSFLLVVGAASVQRALTPPNPRIAKEDVVKGDPADRGYRYRAYFDMTTIALLSILDIARNFIAYHDFTSVSNFLCLPQTTIAPALHPMLVAGTLICVAAGALRVWCFAALGPYFDFQLNIKEDHKLVTQGPYAYVRHPSYTANYALFLGGSMIMLSPGHWFRVCGIWSFPIVLMPFWWHFEIVYMTFMLSGRAKVEDELLGKKFGQQWDSYSQRVPHRFIPGIF